MGSPVSVVVAEIVMQNIEEQALATYSETLPLWLRYVDDTIAAVLENKSDKFHEHLNEQDINIQFIKEIKENGKIPFLDCLVTRENNTLRTTVYRKPTHPDRLLDHANVLQSYFTQSDYGTNLDKKSTNFLRLRRQFDRRNLALKHCFY